MFFRSTNARQGSPIGLLEFRILFSLFYPSSCNLDSFPRSGLSRHFNKSQILFISHFVFRFSRRKMNVISRLGKPIGDPLRHSKLRLPLSATYGA